MLMSGSVSCDSHLTMWGPECFERRIVESTRQAECSVRARLFYWSLGTESRLCIIRGGGRNPVGLFGCGLYQTRRQWSMAFRTRQRTKGGRTSGRHEPCTLVGLTGAQQRTAAPLGSRTAAGISRTAATTSSRAEDSVSLSSAFRQWGPACFAPDGCIAQAPAALRVPAPQFRLSRLPYNQIIVQPHGPGRLRLPLRRLGFSKRASKRLPLESGGWPYFEQKSR